MINSYCESSVFIRSLNKDALYAGELFLRLWLLGIAATDMIRLFDVESTLMLLTPALRWIYVCFERLPVAGSCIWLETVIRLY